MNQPTMEWVELDKLKPYDLNPRKNKKAIPVIIASIKEHGFTQPILVDQHMRICIGNTRYQAAKDMGLTSVPVIKKIMNEEQFRDLNIRDNKSSEFSKWDKKQLRNLMEIIDDLESQQAMGFSLDEIDNIFGHKHIETHGSADFGDAGKVDDEIDEEALVKRMQFVFNGKEHKFVKNKLDAIKKEHGLSNLGEALIEALKPYKGVSGGPRIRKGGQ